MYVYKCVYQIVVFVSVSVTRVPTVPSNNVQIPNCCENSENLINCETYLKKTQNIDYIVNKIMLTNVWV